MPSRRLPGQALQSILILKVSQRSVRIFRGNPHREILYGLLTLFESLNDESKNDKGKENDIQLVISSCYAPEAF